MAHEKRDFWATVSDEGQVTIPPETREALGLSGRSTVIFRIEDGNIVLRKATVADVTGSAPKLKEPKTWDEIKAIVDKERAEDYRRKMREGNA